LLPKVFGVTEAQFRVYFDAVNECQRKRSDLKDTFYHLSPRGTRIVRETLAVLRSELVPPGKYASICGAFSVPRTDYDVYASVMRTIRTTGLANTRHFSKDRSFAYPKMNRFWRGNKALFSLCRILMANEITREQLMEYYGLKPARRSIKMNMDQAIGWDIDIALANHMILVLHHHVFNKIASALDPTFTIRVTSKLSSKPNSFLSTSPLICIGKNEERKKNSNVFSSKKVFLVNKLMLPLLSYSRILLRKL
ncbi:MAG: hypothetical protein V2I33_22240, partial [Kangiellaceae bacterium]|nr:hypothetical protein [Kangiellaceae bacterium]